jgi:proton glutamate symport protein
MAPSCGTPAQAVGSFQAPATAVLLLFGVGALLEMDPSGMNVIGNCMAAAVVARWEGKLK